MTKGPEWTAVADADYAALGKYFAAFADMTYHLRNGLVRALAADGKEQVLTVAFGQSTAQQLADAFFAAARLLPPERAEGELKWLKLVSNELNELITERNDFAHGDLYFGWGDGQSPTPLPPWLERIKPNRKAGEFVTTALSAEDLVASADRVHDVALVVFYIGTRLRFRAPFTDPPLLLVDGRVRVVHPSNDAQDPGAVETAPGS